MQWWSCVEVGGEREGVVMEVVCLCEMGGEGECVVVIHLYCCHGVARGSYIVSSFALICFKLI